MYRKEPLSASRQNAIQDQQDQNVDREKVDIVLIDARVSLKAQEYLKACEQCAAHAAMPFDYLLDAVTGCDPSLTEYLMCLAGRCPSCNGEIFEKTLVVA